MTFTIKEGWEEAFARFYTKENINYFNLSMGLNGQNATSQTLTPYTDSYDVGEQGNITIKITPDFFDSRANYIFYGGSLRYKNQGISGEGFNQFAYWLYENSTASVFGATIPTSDRITIRAQDYVYTPVLLTFLQSGQQISPGQTLRINPSYEDDDARTEYRRRIKAIKLIFLNSTTNSTTAVNISTWTDLGTRATFVLPTIEDLPIGSTLQSIEVDFSSASGGDDFKAVLNLEGTNTTYTANN